MPVNTPIDFIDAYQSWLKDPVIDPDTKAELQDISHDPKEIEDRFYKNLDFGTGGMRGIIGAGTNRINIYTIRKATQGLANYILATSACDATNPEHPPQAVAIAHDSRHMSQEFATEAALVLAANGIKAYTFDALRPTPLLSFAVRHLGCIAGIVVTASHNPPEYNGYKVYWSDGGQCPSPRDEEIIAEVEKVTHFVMVKTMPKVLAEEAGLFALAPPEIDQAFHNHVMSLRLNPGVAPQSNMGIVYTPLHGAGNVPVQTILQAAGFQHVHTVPEQEVPDGDFPTVSYPNPEDIAAFTLGIALAQEKGADIVLATDPDCDRVGAAVKHHGDYKLLSGNATGVLLADYIITQKQANGTLPANGAILSTIVSTKMTQAIAKAHGLAYMEVLTGFKYIGEKIKAFEDTGSHQYIFGFEESFGYLAGTHARDKDAVGGALLICEMAAHYHAQGLTLFDALAQLHKTYGVFKEHTESITLKGIDGVEKMKKIMAQLRQRPPAALNGDKVVAIRDYQSGQQTCLLTGATEPTHLPISNVLYYQLETGAWLCVRPSGTEPKIKIYFGTTGATEAQAQATLEALVAAMFSLLPV